MNLWCKCGNLLVVVVLALAVAGCGHDTYYTAVEEDKWHTITITSPQEEGEKKLLIELPGELEQCGAFEDEATVKDHEVFRHCGSCIMVAVHHANMADPRSRVKFTVSGFMRDFDNMDIMEPVLKKEEKRIINGQEMTYMDISMKDKAGHLARGECLGTYTGSGFWMVVFFYRPEVKEMRDLTERAMASISLE